MDSYKVYDYRGKVVLETLSHDEAYARARMMSGRVEEYDNLRLPPTP